MPKNEAAPLWRTIQPVAGLGLLLVFLVKFAHLPLLWMD
jgi:hypothetical protein